ncbi:MAG TPA: hypothetical protein V6C58_04395 [Allocoleopsis sp.]
MASNDSDDYEILPIQELEDLRREVNSLKRNNLTEGDKAKVLIESIDRLTISVNRLITILDDAQKDIIDEYQQSKPVETLHQIAEQNEMIAKALLAISDNFNGGKSVVFPSSYEAPDGDSTSPPGSRSILPTSFSSQQQMNNQMNNPMNNQMQQNIQQMPGPAAMQNSGMMGSMGGNQQMNNMQFNNPQASRLRGMQQPSGIVMPPMDDMPPMDSIPPLNPPSSPDKKKFLGIL